MAKARNCIALHVSDADAIQILERADSLRAAHKGLSEQEAVTAAVEQILGELRGTVAAPAAASEPAVPAVADSGTPAAPEKTSPFAGLGVGTPTKPLTDKITDE